MGWTFHSVSDDVNNSMGKQEHTAYEPNNRHGTLSFVDTT